MSETNNPAAANPAPVSTVILWEEDDRFVEPVRQALAGIDPKYSLLRAKDKEEFEKILNEGTPEFPPGARACLLILKSDPNISVADRGPVIVVDFEHSEDLVRQWAARGVFNLLFKPYDPLLLKQHLLMALSGDHPPGEFTVHNMKTTALIEMLKSIPMEALSEVGFTTRSDREVPHGRVTKFYGKVFEWGTQLSVFARCHDQRAHPLAPNEKTIFLTWFGTPREQLLQIRSRFTKKEELPLVWKENKPTETVNFLILGDPSPAGSDLAGTLSRTFSSSVIQSYTDLPGPKVPLPSPLTAVFVHRDLLDRCMTDPRFKEIPRIILVTATPKDEEFRAFADKSIDVVKLPTERMAFVKTMSVLFPQMKADEELSIHSFPWKENLDVGQAIEITEMNEAGLVMKYERALPIGTVRRFVLWLPVEAGMPFLTARCYLARPGPGQAGGFLNHFVFFGMSDHEIKHVRLWMRDNYIQQKNKG
ncbi:MAG: hypothetical protein KF802_11275 [Bdellovibrionaceae bacterium]|nr:hypothetical protein [Pseudobdellovibrionaceae bacterium]MBX3032697.1 hypothetical protein [Pseudobdellovibrionaceae bacterium]